MHILSYALRWTLLWCLALGLGVSCTDDYMPDVVESPPNFLVIDGFINTQGVTTIRLSRTYAIRSTQVPPAETRATVYIEEESGPRYLLQETPARSGTYTSANLTLNIARKYRLHLTTTTNGEYASAYVPVKVTPPIDALTWRPTGNGLNVSVSAHDDTGSTQYYRWETEDTWEIKSPYYPTVEYVNNDIRPIAVPFPTVCYGIERAGFVQLYKTTALTQDVVADFRVRQLATTSERLFTRYSILVRQHALTAEEYAYWELLRKNTENIGSLFDPQPAQLTGNVRCLSNPDDLVLGFIGAHSIEEKRLFISRAELPGSWPVVSGYEKCVPPDTVFIPQRGLEPSPPRATILAAFFTPGGVNVPISEARTRNGPVGYLFKTRDCVDCRTRGTSIKPTFWP
ncbi:DUF4249 domain-containing protein [Hymenobacter canadensis]|uniref:DUF4249 domain-containing protein n=1 Tax=Hymenobacter canadensis TaxID=2999067 RepID=A0ABY7LLT6_9BACT|nr:DUF4249 domain-containing protein [Hymenobacter canadensis]WBA41420.1 DUF4249 domain-containing protein [Hymenobacter canadensis]